MWSASGELEIGEPGKAIPFMKKALDALRAARSAERIYLRGKTTAVVVDIDRVRLQGKDKGSSSVRVVRLPADPARDTRIARFDAALQLMRPRPAPPVDSLLLLAPRLARPRRCHLRAQSRPPPTRSAAGRRRHEARSCVRVV